VSTSQAECDSDDYDECTENYEDCWNGGDNDNDNVWQICRCWDELYDCIDDTNSDCLDDWDDIIGNTNWDCDYFFRYILSGSSDDWNDWWDDNIDGVDIDWTDNWDNSWDDNVWHLSLSSDEGHDHVQGECDEFAEYLETYARRICHDYWDDTDDHFEDDDEYCDSFTVSCDVDGDKKRDDEYDADIEFDHDAGSFLAPAFVVLIASLFVQY